MSTKKNLKPTILKAKDLGLADVWYEIEPMQHITMARCYRRKELLFSTTLEKENNRGWTLGCYGLTGARTTLFLSRGIWKEEETGDNPKRPEQ